MMAPNSLSMWIVSAPQSAGLIGLGLILLTLSILGAWTDWRHRR